jgi:ATP-binding cassette subfamily C protein
MLIATAFQVVVAVVLSLLVSWPLALVGLGLGSIIVLILGPLVRVAKKAGKRQQRSTKELVALLSDALVGLKPLKAMSRHEHFLALFEKKAKTLRKALRRQAISTQLLKTLREPIFVAFAAIALYVVHYHLSIPIAQLLVMAVLLERTVRSIGKLQQQLQDAVIHEHAHRAVHDIIDEAGAQREEYQGTRRPTLEQSCVLENVSFAYGGKPVLNDVSMTIPADQLTVIMGPSGIGKTTLTDLLLGLYQPARGRVLIDGVPLAEIDLREWRRMIGYVPQELLLFHDTIFANVALGDATISEQQVVDALKTAGAWEFVAALPDGLMTSAGERGAQLSGGQRQRIALARALVTQPRLLVCDEVTSALDPKSEADICQNVRRLDGQLTILAITHRPAWVDVADRVYEIGPGGARLVTDMRRRLAVAPLS